MRRARALILIPKTPGFTRILNGRLFQKCFAALLAIPVLAASIGAAPPKAPKISQIYVTAETATTVEVVWNTTTAADSLLQYSTINPVPAQATQIYLASQATLHEIPLVTLTPGTTFFYKVTSCNKRGCSSATGSFETFPSCPDVVPAVSGSWQRAASSNVGATSNNQLFGVAAVSESDVWAVGWAQDPIGPSYVKRTLIQHFNGSSWSIVQSPTPANDIDSKLYGVAGLSANDVWAVGSSHNGALPSRTLIQHWNGIQWSNVPSPSPDSQFNELRGVVALAHDNVWAVGYRGGSKRDTPIETLILHWDGSSWRVIESPNIGGSANQLFGISVIAANDIWAVGSVSGAPLSIHWDGNAWNVVPTNIRDGLSTGKLNAVSGNASNDVWAVGEGKGIYTNQTFATIMHWDGTRWTEKTCRAASSTNPPDDYEGTGTDAYLTGVAAASANDVWAVGVRGAGPMILHWDGTAWTTVTHPRAFPDAAVLRAVTTSRGGRAWSVGLEVEISSTTVSNERTLIDTYSP